jgi:hypothetical protein
VRLNDAYLRDRNDEASAAPTIFLLLR